MAATHYSTSPLPAGREDADHSQLVTYEEASGLLARTGHKVSPTTLRRYGLNKVRKGRTDYVDWADVLEEHFRRTAVKLRASADWP